MISKKVQKAFNEQINAEVHSAYLYLSMAAYFDNINLGGFAGWMKKQAQEEWAHAMKFYGHVNERGGRVTLTDITGVATEWDSPVQAFEAAYAHEQHITELIHKLVGLCREQNDIAGENFLQWFVAEQVEEEAQADDIVQKLKMVDGKPQGLLMLDSILGRRE